MLATLVQSNPTLEAMFSERAQDTEPFGLRVLNTLTPGLVVGRTPDAAFVAGIGAQNARNAEVIADRVSRAMDMKRRDAIKYLQEEAKSWPKDERREIERWMLQAYVSRLRSRAINTGRARMEQRRK